MSPQSDNELMRVIGRIEGKIDGMISQHQTLHSEHKDLKTLVAKLEYRIQQVENRLYLYAGAVAVMSPVAYMMLKPVIDRMVGP